MIKAYIKYWKKAGDLKSYSNRSDYWWVFLTNSIIFAILSILNFMVTIPKAGKIMSQSATLSQKEIIQQVTDLYAKPTGGALVIIIVTALIGLAILVPNISLTARRLRDARFPWWIALVFGVAAIHQDLLAKMGYFVGFINFIIYILCLFPTKYGIDEEDDSRTYE